MTGPPSLAYSQLTCRYTGPNLPFGAVTTHGITTPVGDVVDVLTALINFGQAIVEPLNPATTMIEMLWKVGPVATGPSTLISINENGSQSGEPGAPHTAYLINLPVVGMSGRFAGRFFLPGVNEDTVQGNGVLDNGFRSNLQAFIVTAYADLEAAVESVPVVYASNGDVHEVDAVLANTRVATQRRRLRH